jgi:hypothetical protein
MKLTEYQKYKQAMKKRAKDVLAQNLKNEQIIPKYERAGIINRLNTEFGNLDTVLFICENQPPIVLRIYESYKEYPAKEIAGAYVVERLKMKNRESTLGKGYW